MKNVIKLLICSIIAQLLVLPVYAENEASSVWRDIYVSPYGNDSGSGTKSSPFLTIEKAKDYVSEINDEMQGDIVVHVAEGTYYLEDTLCFTNEDSGKNGHKIRYVGENMPLISGGVPVTDFERVGDSNIFRADLEGVSMMREMYVDGRKCYVASNNRCVTGIGYYDDPKTTYTYDGMYMSRADIEEFRNPEDIEFFWLCQWKICSALVEDIIPDPENDSQVIVKMQQSWWERVSSLGDDSYTAKPYRPFTIKNAYELLDKPGEFYYDKKEKAVYYIPREGENLDTAEVIAPKIDKLLKFDGNDADDRVENIAFEGFRIANGAFYGTDGGGVETGQAQNFSRTNDVPWYVPSSISLERSNNIEFTKNYFYGFGAVGIELRDAVDNTVINGNAFSDIGDAAIAVGRHYQGGLGAKFNYDKEVVPPADIEECNLIDGKVKVATSYFSDIAPVSGGKNWFDEDEEIKLSGRWYSDPYAVAKNEKSWVRYDFENRYSISTVKLGFESSIGPEARSGYEILLSNDREFKEGNYVVAATQVGPAADIQDYEINTTEKYRFLMIRTIDATPLAISAVWALTKDRKPFTDGVLTKNNIVTNNYITRSGETLWSGGGIGVIYTRGMVIADNEISYTPYSGVMVGWGWGYNDDTSIDNKIERNYIHHTNLLLDDGGGIYMLSNQVGTELNGNYITDVIAGRAAIYPDNGSSEMSFDRNVAENVVDNYFIWVYSVRNNSFTNSYGWIDQQINNGTNNKIENLRSYLPGNDLGEVFEIKKNAGLKDEYKYLKDLVPDTEIEIMDSRTAFDLLEAEEVSYVERYANGVINNMFLSGRFGVCPGDYPIEYKFRLQNAKSEMQGKTNDDYVDSVLKIRDLISETVNSIERYSFEEMLKLCKDTLNSTVVSYDKHIENSVNASEYNAFKVAVADVEKKAQGADEARKFELLKLLETAYHDLDACRASTDIEFLYIDGMIDETIDREKKEITVILPSNKDLAKCDYEVVCAGTGEVAMLEETLNLSDDFEIPVYCKSTDKYTYWNVKVVRSDADEWNTLEYDRSFIVNDADGNTVLAPNKFPFMNSRYFESGKMQTIRFVPMGNDYNKISFIFSAGNSGDFDMTSRYEKDSHLRIEAQNGKAKVISRSSGNEVVLKENIDLNLNMGVENTLSIKVMYKKDNMYIFSVFSDGNLVTSFVTDKTFDGGYTGIYSEEMVVAVKKQ